MLIYGCTVGFVWPTWSPERIVIAVVMATVGYERRVTAAVKLTEG